MIQIRRNVFETNSSSVHSLTLTTQSKYNLWKNGEAYLSGSEILTKDELLVAWEKSWYKKTYPEDTLEDYFEYEEIKTYDEYWENCEYETYDKTMKLGEETVIAFGYYGHD